MSYQVKLSVFEGPLDLLLFLIKKEEIDIYDIPIAYITEQYLLYLEAMKELDLDVASEFLVMAATLLQIKSRMLLPKTQEGSREEEDPRRPLVEQLLEYERIKQAASLLGSRWEEEKNWEDVLLDIDSYDGLGEDGSFVLLANNVFDLLTVFSQLVHSQKRDAFVHEVVLENYSVEEKLHQLLHLLVKYPYLRIGPLLERTKNKLELVAIFMAVLELVKLGEAMVKQEQIWGEIELFRMDKTWMS